MTAPTPETQPVINSPYTEPKWHWELDADGRALPNLSKGRRVSASRTMVPQAKKVSSQESINLDEGAHAFINQVRAKVAEWRRANYPQIARISHDLLTHWKLAGANVGPRNRLFFAQVEALETLMWLYEAPGKHTKEFKKELNTHNKNHNEGCHRLAVCMATGTGKTIVMAMLIAWHTMLSLHGGSKQSAAHARTFVIITPGLTVKDRLQELNPQKAGHIYWEQNLLPRKYKQDILQAQVRIVNFQAFRQRELLAGASADQKNMIELARQRRGTAGQVNSAEHYSSMLERVLGLPSGAQYRNLVVLNDEAHHCYGENPSSLKAFKQQKITQKETFSKKEAESQKFNAKQWFSILEGLHRQKRLLVAHDLSATPYYVSEQDYRFPWILSDYDLHEAMEAGLVKIPRVPVDDDARSADVVLRELYTNTSPKKLKCSDMPNLVKRAMESLYSSYEQRTADWRQAGHERPPVLIVVANTISNATALYDWIGGYQMDSTWVEGQFALLSNVGPDRQRKPNPVTMIVHSDKLEDEATAKLTGSGADRMALITEEVARVRGEEAQAQGKKQQADYLRRILATVGKKNESGENIRCVISVGMLTEGWDARTVTHILGFRSFDSPLLCEQVAGRALRRVNYQALQDFADEPVLKAEYAEILGIPFRFSNAQGKEPPQPPEKTIEVMTQCQHEAHRIRWPQVEKYRRVIQPGAICLDPDRVQPFDASTSQDEPTLSELAGTIGEFELLASSEVRQQQVHYKFARYALKNLAKIDNDGTKGIPPTIRSFVQLLLAVRAWIKHPDIKTSDPWWQLISPSILENAIKAFLNACEVNDSALKIAVDLADLPLLDTSAIRFETSISGEMPGRQSGPVAYPARLDNTSRRPFNQSSELNVAVCDSRLEWRIAQILDCPQLTDTVRAWVRNLRLGWSIPWLDKKGIWHDYIPDFVVRLQDCPKTGQRRHVVLEGKGFPDKDWAQKRTTVIDYWLPGVNASANDACSGRWLLLEVVADKQRIETKSELVCTADQLATKLKQLKERIDVWN